MLRAASGESSTGNQDTFVAHLCFTTGPLHHEVDSGKLLSGETVMAAKPFQRQLEERQWKSTLCTETEARKANTPRARKARTRAKESTRVNTRAVLILRATVVTVESGDTSRKTVNTITLAEVDEEESVEPPNSSASSRTTESHLHLLVCLQLELRSPRWRRSPR